MAVQWLLSLLLEIESCIMMMDETKIVVVVADGGGGHLALLIDFHFPTINICHPIKLIVNENIATIFDVDHPLFLLLLLLLMIMMMMMMMNDVVMGNMAVVDDDD